MSTERQAHAKTRAERDSLLLVESVLRRWANGRLSDAQLRDAVMPLFDVLDIIRGNCRTCGTPNVPEAQFIGDRCGYCVADERNRALAAGVDQDPDAHWVKPVDQPATGPLRRKLALARGVLMQVAAAKGGEDKHPSFDELEAIIEETADP